METEYETMYKHNGDIDGDTIPIVKLVIDNINEGLMAIRLH